MPIPSGPVPYFSPGRGLQSGGLLQKLALLIGGATGAFPLTAKAGGTATGATPITSTNTEVTIVATAADSVLLPPSYAGLRILVVNADAADSMQVFASGTDTINAINGQTTGVAQGAGLSALYWSPVAGKWYRLLSA